ncbi:MAG: class I SAM-dependent methyltransferase [Anaerolineaceae bacterium]|nr:class I SAM-dependent methyltransferase [Anaerolineaceae bacterium]
MQKSIIQALIDLNDRFYTDYGASFASTRKRVQPGVLQVLDDWVKPGNWLDLGCGSGALGGIWVERGIQGLYEGLDFSPVLIAEAQATTGQMLLAEGQKVRYARANLGAAGWAQQCSLNRYDGILMFAAMHHLPGHETHLGLIRQVAELMAPGGLFIHSEWQFQRSPKLMARVQDWRLAGLDAADLEPGDTLLDWRQNEASKPGLRYVHLFSSDELAGLAVAGGFKIVGQFDSDGAGGNLSLYQIWQKQ